MNVIRLAEISAIRAKIIINLIQLNIIDSLKLSRTMTKNMIEWFLSI